MNSFVAHELYRDIFYWTGGYKTKDKEWPYRVSWRWWSDDTEESMTYTSWDWLSGEPDGENKKDILVEEDVQDRIAIALTGEWYDKSGIEEHSFVCTKKANPGNVSKSNIIK